MDTHCLDALTRLLNRHKLSRRVLSRGGLGVALAALASGNRTGERTARAAEAGRVEGDFAGLVDIGGRSLYMESHGSGGPTVVLEAGGLARGDVWSRDNLEPVGKRTMVLPAIAGLTRVITYDRPGTIGEVNPDLLPSAPLFYPSRSDPVLQPRTARDVVADLHALLTTAAIPGPYVFAGHSLGGLCARLYASTYPDEVVGMVLIDATHEDVWVEFKRVLTAEQWAMFEEFSSENTELMAAYPEAEQLTPAPLDTTPTTTQMREAQIESPLKPMPLAVLSHGIPFAAPFPGWPSDEIEGIMLELQDDLARLVPNARHVIAHQSGHNIHQDQPELVIEAIRQVVETVRDPSSWAVSTPIAAASSAGPVDIGGRTLFLESRGSGGPTVILEAGAGNNAQIWDTIALPAGMASTAVFPGVAAFNHVCAYDRPNTYLDPDHPSRSDPLTGERSASEMVADLRALLEAAGIPGPYVLVGHSFGGLIVRLFATMYPDEVAGLVLVDAAHEDWWSTLDNLLSPEQREVLHAEPEGFPGMEIIDTNASATQMREAAAKSPLPRVPMVVLTHGLPWDWPPGFPSEQIEAAWLPLQERLAALIPGAELITARRSGHFIQLDEPELVIDAIRRVVEAARATGLHRSPATAARFSSGFKHAFH